MAEKKGLRKVVAASVVGTSLEWYDFFLYGSAAALVFNELFFPNSPPLVGTLLAFSTYSVGFVARPIGAAVFGGLGDKAGRRRVLVITLLIMGISTFLIGCLPTYDSIGVAAPILLVVLRFVQGLGLGGEWGGAVSLVSEHGERRRRGFFASLPQLGVPLGNLLASGVLAVLAAALSDDAFTSWGWRIPFLLSAALIVAGLLIRLRVEESPVFKEAERRDETPDAPVTEVIKTHPGALALAVGARFGVDVAFYTFALFILTYVTEELGLARGVGLAAVLIGSALQLALIPYAGSLSDRLGRRPVYMAGAIGAAAWVWVFFALLDTESTVWIIVAAVVGLALHAFMYGPQAAYLTELFATRVRATGTSLGYQLAGIIGGGLAPLISVALLDSAGTWTPVAIFVAASLAVTVVTLSISRETVAADLERGRPAT